MLNSDLFSGKTMELDDKLRSEIENELIMRDYTARWL